MEASPFQRSAGPATQDRIALRCSDEPALPPLDWKLTRSCSMRPEIFFLNVGMLSVFSAAAGTAFWMAGYPLILFFCGCKIAALCVSALAYARHAVDGERVRLQGTTVYVESVCGARQTQLEFPLCWVQLERLPSGELLLRSSGVTVPLGGQLTPARRQVFAAEFAASLAWARRWGLPTAPS